MKIKNRLKVIKWCIQLFFVSLVYLMDYRYFTSPPLHSDDWEWLVWRFIFDPFKFINWADRRPFFASLLVVLTPILRLNIAWYYVVNFLLIFISGIIVLLIVKKTFPNFQWIALPVSLIFLIYPINYAKTWLILLSIHLAMILALSAILMMITYARSGKILHLIAGILFSLISFGIYEAGLGIVMLASLFISFFALEFTRKRRLPILSVFLTGMIFILWRIFIQPNVLNTQDYYLETINISFVNIIQRYIQGLFIALFNWVGPLLTGFGRYKYWVFVGLGLVLIIIFLILLPKLLKSAKSKETFPYQKRVNEIKSLVRIAVIGILFWAAGYIPVISLYQPIFYGDGSRVNYFSVPGASLAVVAGIACLIFLLLEKKDQIKRIVLIVSIPLVIIGSIYQIHAQNERFRVWEINKSFWHEMFELIPGIKERTKLVIVIPGYEDLEPFEMYPFAGDWEAQSAFSILYNEKDLFARYYYIDIPSGPGNQLPDDMDWSQYIFVYYNPSHSSLRIIEDPTKALSLSFDLQGYDPQNRIQPYSPDINQYRWLVD